MVQAATEIAVAAARSADPPWVVNGVETVQPFQDEPASPEFIAAREARQATSQIVLRPLQLGDGKTEREEDPRSVAVSKLKAARKKALDAGATVRSDAFDDWFGRCVVPALQPKEWTKARTLYESYVRHAGRYGWNLTDRVVSREELATETGWGKMMAGLSIKKRRASGWHYPLRLKQGA